MTKTPQSTDPSKPTTVDQETPTRAAPTTDEERIDESVDESFPASDPPAVHSTDKR